MADWIGVYLKENMATSIGMAGLGYAFFSLAMVAGRFSCDSVAAHMLPRKMVRLSGITVVVGLTLGLWVNTPWAMLAASLAVGVGLSPVIPAILRAGGQIPHVPPSQALATLATMSYGGFLFGPPSIGLVAEYVGLRLGLGLVAILAVVLTILAQWMPKPARVPKARPEPALAPSANVGA
jgi:MFS family permease